MTTEQFLIIAILLATLGMFLWGRWRHDMVALGSLLACVVAGLIDPSVAFNGFGHPAVITVACVLVLSRGLQSSGAVDALARVALPGDAGPLASLAAIVVLGAVLSALIQAGLPAVFTTNGQRVPEDLQPARAHPLVTRDAELLVENPVGVDAGYMALALGGSNHHANV